MDNYNPFDILQKEEVQQHYANICNSVRMANNPSNFTCERNYKFFAEKDLPYSHIYAKVILSSINLYNFISINKLLQTFQQEQISFLKDNPQYLKRELERCLIVSVLLLNEYYRREEAVKGKSLFSLLRNYLFGDPLNLIKKRMEKRRKEMNTCLNILFSLLFNAYYKNGNQNIEDVDNILKDIVSTTAWDNDELCFYRFKTIMDSTIKEYLVKEFDLLCKYSESHKILFPSLIAILDRCKPLYESRIAELSSIEKERYNHYRSLIDECRSQYPAKQDSNNYKMVEDGIKKVSHESNVCISLETKLKEIFVINSSKHKELCEWFFSIKKYKIPIYYFEIFNTVADIVSYWNAFDDEKNGESVMGL